MMVDIVNRIYTCREWDILELPCKHAFVLKSFFVAYTFVKYFLTTKAYRQSYSEFVALILDLENLQTDPRNIKIQLPKTIRLQGRANE